MIPKFILTTSRFYKIVYLITTNEGSPHGKITAVLDCCLKVSIVMFLGWVFVIKKSQIITYNEMGLFYKKYKDLLT